MVTTEQLYADTVESIRASILEVDDTDPRLFFLGIHQVATMRHLARAARREVSEGLAQWQSEARAYGIELRTVGDVADWAGNGLQWVRLVPSELSIENL